MFPENRRLAALVVATVLALMVLALLLMAGDTTKWPTLGGELVGGSAAGPVQVGDGATVCGEGLRVHVSDSDVDVVHTRLRRADTEVDCGPGLHGWVSGRGREVLALCLPSSEEAGAEPFVYVRTQPDHPSVTESGQVVVDVFPSLPSEENGRTKSWLFGRAGLSELSLFGSDGGEEGVVAASMEAGAEDSAAAKSEHSGREFEASFPSDGSIRLCARVLATVELKKNAGVPELAGVLGEGGAARVVGEVALIE